MTTTLKPLMGQPVIEKTITQQCMELPLESVVIIKRPKGFRADIPSATVVHRTGSDGWLSTRALTERIGGSGHYIKRSTILDWFERAERQNATFEVVDFGDGVFLDAETGNRVNL